MLFGLVKTWRLIMKSRKTVTDSITEDVSAYTSITGDFESEVYAGTPLLDTAAKINIEVCITWKDREKLMKELAELLKEYII
jgi:hypothetical protein